jgi:hypothetical protein
MDAPLAWPVGGTWLNTRMAGGFARVSGIVLECPNPAGLARFYSELTGWPILFSDAEWVSIGPDEAFRPRLSFQLAPGHQRPTWPDDASSMQFHIDFTVDDLDVAEQAAIALGATKFAHQPSPSDFRVLADPVGHPFCVCRE